MAAQPREEDPARAHPQHGRDVLDQRLHPACQAGVCVEAEEALDVRRVRRREIAELGGRLRREQVDGQHGRADPGGEVGAPLIP